MSRVNSSLGNAELMGDTQSMAAAGLVGKNVVGSHESYDSSEAVRILNGFLRGAISATETYRMAIEKVTAKMDAAPSNLIVLRQIQEEHGRACQSIRHRIRELGGEAVDSSGAWGVWAKFTMGSAELFGDAAALKALKEGEEHGLKEYEGGLSDLDATSADMVQSQLVPMQSRHISVLDRLLAQIQS